MRIGLVGPTNDERSLPFDAQRTINLYPVFDQTGKEVSALYGVAGTKEEWDLEGCQLLYRASNGSVFAIVNDALYELFDKTKPIPEVVRALISATAPAELADVETNYFRKLGQFDNGDFLIPTTFNLLRDTGREYSIDQIVKQYTVAEDQTGLLICNGIALYKHFYGTSFGSTVPGSANLSKVSGTPFELDLTVDPIVWGAGSISFANGFVIAQENLTRRFWISSQFDGSTWNSLDFATKESYYDRLNFVRGVGGNLWLFGEESIEIWGLSGDPDFPFGRISGAAITIGTNARDTVVDLGGIVLFVGKDRLGNGAVYAAAGTSLNTISTGPIERKLQESGDLSTLRAFSYREEGHTFYVITAGGLETALVYDVITKQWHERAFMDSCGEFIPFKYTTHCFGFNRHFVGGEGVKIAHLSEDYYDYDGDVIPRERVYTHIADEERRIRINSLDIGFEVGTGLQTGQGSNPKVMMSVSKDGGRTYSNWREDEIGKVGKYTEKVSYRRIGIAEQFTFRIRITDPVKVAICGSYIK